MKNIQKRKNMKSIQKKKNYDKIKNLISLILPLTTIFVVALAFRNPPTGLAVLEEKELYRINGTVSITLQEKIPADSYIQVKIDSYITKINIIDFLKKSGKPYKISEGNIVVDDTCNVDFTSLGVMQSFEKGNHKIITEIIHKGAILYSNEEIIEI